MMKYFTISELVHSNTADRLKIDNMPTLEHINNLKRLIATLLEPLRIALGAPITVTSGYRCPQLNQAIGSKSKNSQHLFGCAADIKSNAISPLELAKLVLKLDLPFDQLILEYAHPTLHHRGWVHLSCPNDPNNKPRYEKLVISHKGITLVHNYIDIDYLLSHD